MEQQLSDLVSDGVNLYEEGMLGYNRAGGTDDRSCLDVYAVVTPAYQLPELLLQ